MLSVRDARVHEDDALLGVVHIALGPALLSHGMSRFDGYHPLAGGIGYGRVRISVVFRSVQLTLPPNLLGWDYGTLEIAPDMSWVGGEKPHELASCKIKVHSVGGKGKLYPTDRYSFGNTHMSSQQDHSNKGGLQVLSHIPGLSHLPGIGPKHTDHEQQTEHSQSDAFAKDHSHAKWAAYHAQPISMPVRNRYSQALVFEFRTRRRHHVSQHEHKGLQNPFTALTPEKALGSKTAAFAILWLHNIADEEEQELELIVWRHEDAGPRSNLHRASTNVLPGDKSGEKLGLLSCKVRYWRGLGVAHEKWARHSEHLQSTMETLNAARDEGLIAGIVGDPQWLKARERGEIGDDGQKGGEAEGYSSDSDDSDRDEDAGQRRDDQEGLSRHGYTQTNGQRRVNNDDDDHAREGREEYRIEQENEHPAPGRKTSRGNVFDDIKDYNKNHNELHRKQRGIMQWKVRDFLCSGVAET